MADENVVGKINEILGGGEALIIRASGERVIAKAGDLILAGDSVVTSASTSILIDVDANSVAAGKLSGVVTIGGGEFARFDSVLFDGAASLLSDSSEEDPVNVGSKPDFTMVRAFNEAFPDAGITTANEDSQSDTIVNLENEFDPTSAGSNQNSPDGVDTSGANTISRLGVEEIPDAGTVTDRGSLGDGTRNQKIPDDGVTTVNNGPQTPTINTAPPAPTDISAPITAVNDTVSGTEDTPITINVLGNDDLANTTGTVSLPSTTTANGGTISLNIVDGKQDGTINYTPAANYNGADTFTYTITNSTGQTSTATVTVNVTPVDDGEPDAVDDAFTTNEDQPLTGNVIGNAGGGADTTTDNADVDPFTGATTEGGTVTIAANGDFTYTPRNNFFSTLTTPTDSFTYTLRDQDGQTSTATVTVTVNSQDDPAVISGNTTGSGAEDGGAITGTLNATDVEGLTDGTYFTVTGAATNGTAGIDPATGAWTYTPNADYNGADSFTVTVTDDLGGTTTQVVNLTVNAVADITADTISTDEDTAVTENLITGAGAATPDSFEGTPSITSVTQGTNGTVAIIDANAGTVRYTPNADFNGTDSYTYTVTSPAGVTETATVNVTVNAVADITADTLSTAPNTAITANLLDGTTGGATADTFEGSPVITSVTQGANGTVAIGTGGEVTYTPNTGFTGADTYTYTVTSPTGVTETATVTVNVNPPSVITGDITGTGDEDGGAITGDLNATDVDGLSDGTYFTVTGAATNGTAGIDPATGAWTYTPNADYNGADSFTVTVTDDAEGTTTQVVNLTVNAVADITADTISTDEDTAVTENLITGAGAATPDSFEGTPSITSVTQGTNGTVAIIDANAGTVRYTPNADFNGTDSYTYTVTSPAGVTETATVNVTVNAVADITADTLSTTKDTAITANLLDGTTGGATADTFEGSPVITSVTQGANGTVAIGTGGEVTYTPNTGFDGTDSYTYTVTSPAGITETATVNVTVTNVVPALDLDGDNSAAAGTSYAATFTENGGAIAIADSDTTISDADDTNMESATITLTNAQTDDVMSVLGTLPAGITSSINTATPGVITVTLSGSATLASYQTAIAQVQFDNASETPNTTSRNITVTVNDGAVDSNIAVSTITVTAVNDVPVNTVPSTQAVNTSTATVVFNGANAISTADLDNDIQSIVLSVDTGTLTVSGTIDAGITVTNNGSGTVTITGAANGSQDALVRAVIETVTYTPADVNDAHVAQVIVTTTDSQNVTDTDSVLVRYVGAETSPTLDNLAGTIPEGTGLLLRTFGETLPGAGPVNDGATTIDANNIEAEILGDTVTSTVRIASVGNVLARNLSETASVGTGEYTFAFSAGDNQQAAITGLIYLEAGVSYKFDGYVDDGVHIAVGGNVYVNTGSSPSSNAGQMGSLAAPFTNTSFTVPEDGYYTLEAYLSNVFSIGRLLLNLNANGNPAELSVANYSLFAGVDELIAAGGQIGNYEALNANGGYFKVDATGADVVGVSGSDVSMALLPVVTSASEVINNIKLTLVDSGSDRTDLDGAQLIDTTGGGSVVVGTFNAAGSFEITFTPLSSVNTGGVNLSNLVLRGASGAAITAGTYDFAVQANSQTLTGTDAIDNPLTAASLGNFTVTVLASTYATDGGNSADAVILNPNASDGDSNAVIASGIEDDLTLSGAASTSETLYGSGGNDQLTGSEGNNLIQGGLGEDIINGAGGADFIVGGQGDDKLTGGEGRDTFVWRSGDQTGAATDTIIDFTTAGGSSDRLDFDNLLNGAYSGNVSDYISLADNGTDTTLTFDIDGSTGGSAFDDMTIVLKGVTGSTLSNLVSNGNIDVGDDRNIIFGTTIFETLTGTANGEIFAGKGLSSGRETINSNGGRDTLWFQGTDTGIAGDVGARNGTGHYEMRGWTPFETNGGGVTEQDTIKLGDLFRAGDANYDGTAADAVRFLHITTSNYFGRGIIYIDKDGQLGDNTSTHRTPVSGARPQDGIDAAGVDTIQPEFMLEFQNNYLSLLAQNLNAVSDVSGTGAALGAGDNNTAAHIQRLVDIGLLDIS